MTKSDIFKMAWTMAHAARMNHGGKSRQYISSCLKKAYIIARINAASWKQKKYAADLATNALFVLNHGIRVAVDAGATAFANAAKEAICKINKMKNARQIIDSLKDVNFHKGSQLKEWHTKN
ncbi:hypothetical protein [Dickeya chrysanthemi]|uniref:hypothetical protein n=1 Tax=Dickeya chrysanthemi TaxID=556 RepID=UPI000532B6E3|nr:hypothetical protein [Dickeya chrysanthemi]